MPQRLNRRFILRERPSGDFDPKVLQKVVAPAPAIGPGEALVRVLYLSLDPTNRIWMSEGDSYLPPVPLGEVMRGGGVGVVVESNNAGFPVGAKVGGLFGWQDYAVVSSTGEAMAQVIPGWLPVLPLAAPLLLWRRQQRRQSSSVSP